MTSNFPRDKSKEVVVLEKLLLNMGFPQGRTWRTPAGGVGGRFGSYEHGVICLPPWSEAMFETFPPKLTELVLDDEWNKAVGRIPPMVAPLAEE